MMNDGMSNYLARITGRRYMPIPKTRGCKHLGTYMYVYMKNVTGNGGSVLHHTLDAKKKKRNPKKKKRERPVARQDRD